MLGFYDYTVWLTYLSLISAGTGIIVCLNGSGHPFLGVFFLLICGLCDAFDGRVARTKKNRTQMEKNFGIQIDSLADMVAFGVLPACIGNAMIRVLPSLPEITRMRTQKMTEFPYYVICVMILIFYMLMALIRLAYFNVTEEERQTQETEGRKYYEGLPVTSSALIFPLILTMQYILPMDVTPAYFLMLIAVGCAFVSKIKVPKPGLRGILTMVAVGCLDFLLLVWRSGILR
ncbi:MAG: CDP-alcohol phosphatidyltransferase family protein [Eubacteriales bacterium]|nr:CDP-alcohol phosphatidyltransferase family protein [Eubacteriales bacterium]